MSSETILSSLDALIELARAQFIELQGGNSNVLEGRVRELDQLARKVMGERDAAIECFKHVTDLLAGKKPDTKDLRDELIKKTAQEVVVLRKQHDDLHEGHVINCRITRTIRRELCDLVQELFPLDPVRAKLIMGCEKEETGADEQIKGLKIQPTPENSTGINRRST